MLRDRDYVRDILQCATFAIEHLGQGSEEQFRSDHLIQAAVLYRFLIMGEAVNRISDETQSRFPSLPWKIMRGMRNVLIHEYDEIRLDIVYASVRQDLPLLVIELQRILSQPWPNGEIGP